MIEVHHNLPEFGLALKSFGADFERRTVRSATNAAAQAFKKLAAANVPVRTGKLKRALYVKRSRSKSGAGEEHYFVAFRQGKRHQAIKRKRGAVNLDAYYGRFLEAGWVPRGPGSKLAGGTRSRALARSRNLAAGAAKITRYRFLRPAFERGKGDALRAFYAKIETRIAKENSR